MFQNNSVLHLPRLSSDHAPILTNTDRTNKGKRKFSSKFEYFWVEHPEFNEVVHNSWSSNSLSIVEKLDNMGSDLNKWSKKEFGNIFRAVEELKQELLRVQMESHIRDTRHEEKDLCQKIDYLNLLQQRYFEQRSKVHWIPNIDKNTRAFHLSVIQTRRKNQIEAVKSADGN